MNIPLLAIRYCITILSLQIRLVVIRGCVIALSLLHLAIFISYVVPYMDDPRVSLWQALLPWSSLFAYSRAPFVLLAGILFIPLLLPLCASWAVARFPVRIISLVSVWISLPLLFVACFFWAVLALELYSPASGLLGILRLVIFVPSAGFAFSFLLCLALARCQRLLLASEPAALAIIQPERLASAAGERSGASPISEGEMSTGAGRILPGLSTLGVLCYLLVFVSLFFPYATTYEPSEGTTWNTTGWHMLGQSFPSALLGMFFLLIPLLPVFVLLMCRLPIPFTNRQKDTLFLKSIALSYWLTLLCFILSSIILEYSLLFIGAGANQEVHWLYATLGIPAAGFLLALVCSGVLRGHFLLRSGTRPA